MRLQTDFPRCWQQGQKHKYGDRTHLDAPDPLKSGILAVTLFNLEPNSSPYVFAHFSPSPSPKASPSDHILQTMPFCEVWGLSKKKLSE